MESAVRPLLDAYFSPLSGVQVLAQPGSFYVSSAFSLAVSVIGKELVNRGWDSLAPGERRRSVVRVPLKVAAGDRGQSVLSGPGFPLARGAVEQSATKQRPARRSLPVNNPAGSVFTQVTTMKTQSSCTT